MKYPSKPILAKFISRSNRFLGIVEMNGKYIECFIPNPGRMNELMVPGAKVYLIHKPTDYRRTKYDLTLIEYNDILVSVDSRLPNQILREAIDQKRIEEFQCYKVQQNEPNFHDSRFDFKLTKGTKHILLEAKSCTLVEDGIALFPDAPTKRGARHMRTLIQALNYGRAVVCFIIQRNDAIEWKPNKQMDPEFTQNIIIAEKKGVEIYAYTCKITLEGAKIKKRIPINLE